MEIELIGLRPGERLHEHLFWPGDDVSATSSGVLRADLHRVDGSGWSGVFGTLRHVRHASAVGARSMLAEMNAVSEAGEVRPAVMSG